jgi:Mn2+/Fe2+ NRAMP family transporter
VTERREVTLPVAILGTTISPYLFFWQAGQEVEDEKESATAEPLNEAPEPASALRIGVASGPI